MPPNECPLHKTAFRLVSARQKKRKCKTAFTKKLVQLDNQRSTLWYEKARLPMIPLEQPYQKGWKRFFVVREDVKMSSKAAFFEQLLEKINTVQYAKDKAFRTKKRRKRRRVYEVRKQLLHEFDEWEWNSSWLKLTEEERSLFRRVELWGPKMKYRSISYVFTESWRFVLQVRPHIITHVKMIDALLEGKIQQLSNYIRRYYLDHKIYKTVNGKNQSRNRARGNKKYYLNSLKNKALHTLLDECKEESIV